MDVPPRGSPLALTVLALLCHQPLHPYGIQRLIREWGKDKVVNVGQRASLYRTIDRLCSMDLVVVRDTERDRAYPERTVYEVTDAGREVAREWLLEMLGRPKNEFPEFPAALSHLLLLEPDEILEVLERRADVLRERLAAIDADLATETERGVPRISLMETEYQRAVVAAESNWLDSTVADLRSGELSWSAQDLADAVEAGNASH
jgi:DNA-binding PadR family transcriptional regulator